MSRDPETNLEILPCLCGSPADAGEIEGQRFIVSCSDDIMCGHQTQPYRSRREAINAWNARKLRGDNSDHDAMLAIQELLDGKVWDADAIDRVALIMIEAGYKIRDTDDVDRPDSP
jgi:hypothetical protein